MAVLRRFRALLGYQDEVVHEASGGDAEGDVPPDGGAPAEDDAPPDGGAPAEGDGPGVSGTLEDWASRGMGGYALWSSARLSPGEVVDYRPTIRLFSYTLGKHGPGYSQISTIAQTNMHKGLIAPHGAAFCIGAIRCQVEAEHQADAEAVWQRGVIRWEFSATLVMPIWLVMPICPLAALLSVGGHPHDGGFVYTADFCLCIPGTQSFAVQLQFREQAPAYTLHGKVRIRVSLYGTAQTGSTRR